MKTLLPVFLFSLAIACHLQSQATHLMGGNMTYTYVSFNPANNTHTYQVTLKIYRYCTGTTAALDATTEIGAYAHNPIQPNANKQLVTSVVLPLISQSFIQPPSSNPNCSFTTTACVEEGIYQGNVTLAASTGGYHLIADRCCRNNNIMNLSFPGDAGQAYHAFIPPSSTINSSPTFAIPPVPFMCANDTTSILNAAFDPDGDSLVYSFEIPYNGVSTAVNPIPGPPLTYPWPISQINYAFGYSVTNPFGANGMATINSATGLTTYYSPLAGFFVIAVEIKEYRNGILIGITRRDLQIIVINCPPNPAPVLSTTGGSGQTNIFVPEGTVINFPATFNDPNADSLTVTAAGPIFNPSVTNPPATFTPASGLATVAGLFSWTTSCAQGTTTPYQFVVTATDNGCPAKITNVVYTINVIPVQISSITGPDTLCSQSAGIAYSVVNNSTNTYVWQITGGVQASGGNTNAITVNWTGAGGSVSAWAVNSAGCTSDTVTKNISNTSVAVNAGPDVTLCAGQSVALGTTGNPQYTYQWIPSTGLNNPGIANPMFFAGSNTIGVELLYVVSATVAGCTGYDTVEVTVNAQPSVTFTSPGGVCINGSAVTLAGGSPSGGSYSGNGVANGMFNPSAAGVGNQTLTYNYTSPAGCSGSANAIITVNALPVVSLSLPDTVNLNDPSFALSGGIPSGGIYSGPGVSGGMFNPQNAGTGLHVITYTYTNANGCTNSATASIYVDLIIVTLDPFAPVCVDAAPFALTGGLPVGGTYSGTGISNGIFNPSAAGVGTHTITYSYPNGDPATQTITVNPLPTATVSVAPAIGCQSNTIFVGYGPQDLLLTATSATAVSYQWFLDGVLIPGATSSTHQATVAGTYSVQVTDANGCMSDLSAQAVITTINVVDVRCGNGLKKIILCHVPPGNFYNPQTICIAPSAIPSHLANHPWDCIGPCSLYYSDLKTPETVVEDLHYHISPNPVTYKAEISFMVFEIGYVRIELLDLLGRSIKNIYNNYTEADKESTVEFDVSEFTQGVYLIRIQSPDGVVTEKVTVVK